MPTFKHVTLNIHTPKDPPVSTENFSWANTAHSSLSEYGVHRLRNTPKITSYIPSSTNSPFAISITILDSYVPKNEGDDRESLAAYVYFDGREKEETATLLRRGVETWISSRWVEVKEGELAEREFVFKEVGLENFLNGLDISKSEKQANSKSSGRKAVNRRHSMPAKMIEGEEEEEEGAKESAGQIRVDLFRVRCEGPVRRGVWGGMFKDNNNRTDNEDFGGGVDVSHTAGLSEPKPLDRETVSTQSVSHLDPEGVVYASFVFFYRGERQLKKMGLIKPPPPLPVLTRAETIVTSAAETKWKKQDFASLSSALSSLIPKSDGLLNGKKKGFTDFREGDAEWHQNGHSNGSGKFIPGIHERDDGELLMGDDLSRDARDAIRERMKTEEEVRLEEELVGRVGRIKLKRSHSTSSLQGDGSKSKDATPPPVVGDGNSNNFATTPGNNHLAPEAANTEAETPLKKRRGSGDIDVKSPNLAANNAAAMGRGVGFGHNTPPITSMTAGYGGGKMEFGGLLSSGMEMEEEIL
ncbi:uncharacterized protein H6S33_006654 [Morchella sextelata]|uniref:uncharacterized protein n=1 Tax=Morchella sextelata TaxID=1174677 RepID=UPI001D04F0C6|nr:uncharacterized protein H6S33_006654 [Morchella sextelata]KAH0604277.1 hypothetical protein H6S33_006654 [Morchella sextelata]